MGKGPERSQSDLHPELCTGCQGQESVIVKSGDSAVTQHWLTLDKLPDLCEPPFCHL